MKACPNCYLSFNDGYICPHCRGQLVDYNPDQQSQASPYQSQGAAYQAQQSYYDAPAQHTQFYRSIALFEGCIANALKTTDKQLSTHHHQEAHRFGCVSCVAAFSTWSIRGISGL